MWTLLTLVIIVSTPVIPAVDNRPNIVFIMADDLGWNDVGFHGSNEIPTPNIDALAYSGVILNKYYALPVCTPSRSALMTGKHPIHTGMQHGVLYGAEPRGLPLTEKLLPQWLQELGYSTHCVGKWHLGSWKAAYTPTNRGFDSHLGFWTGHQDYYDHTAVEFHQWGLDMRRGMDVAYDLHGKYSTDVFTQEAVHLIETSNTSQPLFLYLAHAAVHSANPYNFLPAPDETVDSFKYIDDFKRRKFAAVLSHLDNSVGQVVKALKHRGILNNTIIVFSSDNGGPAADFNNNSASNWPLRGVKNTLWEGGVRVAGLLWAPGIKRRVSKQLFHISDWFPTLYTAAGGDVSKLGTIDGMDMWDSLLNDLSSPREILLHNIDDIIPSSALSKGKYKLIIGHSYFGQWDGWYGPSGNNSKYSYSVEGVLKSTAGIALSEAGFNITKNEVLSRRNDSIVRCNNVKEVKCEPNISKCLFNTDEDPCERNNLADEYPDIVKELFDILLSMNETAIPAANLNYDEHGFPYHWNYVYTHFGDYTKTNKTDRKFDFDETTTKYTDSDADVQTEPTEKSEKMIETIFFEYSEPSVTNSQTERFEGTIEESDEIIEIVTKKYTELSETNSEAGVVLI